MAGASDDNDENYWPGYVDALTTMTMVLTFVMMVLGVMVFILSQDATESKLSVIARALKIDSANVSNLSDEDIIAALKNLPREQSNIPSASAPGLFPSSEDQTPRDFKAGGQGISKPPSSTADSPFESPFEGGLVGNKAAGPGGEYLVSDANKLPGKETGTGARAQPGSGGLRFVFDRAALQLPALGTEAIEAFVAAQGAGPILVQATALPMEGGASESRRRAYFRAMLIRSRLVKAGVRPQDIEVQVRDQVQGGTQEVVDITRRAG